MWRERGLRPCSQTSVWDWGRERVPRHARHGRTGRFDKGWGKGLAIDRLCLHGYMVETSLGPPEGCYLSGTVPRGWVPREVERELRGPFEVGPGAEWAWARLNLSGLMASLSPRSLGRVPEGGVCTRPAAPVHAQERGAAGRGQGAGI